ncbi:hypothetical protein, partial [Psychromonas aquimarina]|uniref:hypothetical protein n=1 Tax=Psychromonas aquimarina TaxID=444919 RepID=UPI000560C357
MRLPPTVQISNKDQQPLIKYKKYPLTFSFRYGQQLADLASKVLGHIDSKVSIIGRGWDTQIFKGSECEHSEPFLFIANSNYSTYEILIDCYKCKLPAKLLGGNKAPNTQEILRSLISFKQNNTALHRDHKKYDSFSDLLKRNKNGETIKLANLVEDNIEHAEELINALEWSRQTLA